MILLTILVLIAVLLIALVISAVAVGGAGVIVIFGDVIVCIVFLGLLIRFLWKRKH